LKFKSNKYYVLVSLEDESSIKDIYNSIIVRRCENKNLQHEYIFFKTANEFIEIIERIVDEAESKIIFPHIHLECHGEEEGVKFFNDFILTWSIFGDELSKVNGACGNNLVVTLATCFGGYFVLDLIDKLVSESECRAPALCLIGPDHESNYGELHAGFNDFFNTFLQTRNLKEGFNSMNQNILSGKLILRTCEEIFKMGTHSYLDNVLNKLLANDTLTEANVRKIEGMHLKNKGAYLSNEQSIELRRMIKDINSYEDFFLEKRKQYYWIDKYPENEIRFKKPEFRLKKIST